MNWKSSIKANQMLFAYFPELLLPTVLSSHPRYQLLLSDNWYYPSRSIRLQFSTDITFQPCNSPSNNSTAPIHFHYDTTANFIRRCLSETQFTGHIYIRKLRWCAHCQCTTSATERS